MTAKLDIDGHTVEFSGTIEKKVLELGKNPDTYIFLIEGRPVPVDTEPKPEAYVQALRVASGG
jgi:sulfur carrier protein